MLQEMLAGYEECPLDLSICLVSFDGLQSFDLDEATLKAEATNLGALGVAHLATDREVREFEEILAGLHRRRDDAGEFLRTHKPPPDGSIRRVVTTMPVSGSVRVVVDSGILPGSALTNLAVLHDLAAYGVNPDVAERFGHVPDLELTVLREKSGNLLFSALRHSLMDTRGLKASYVESFAHEELLNDDAELLQGDQELREAVCWRLSKSALHAPDALAASGPAIRQTAFRVVSAVQERRVRQLVAAAMVADSANLEKSREGVPFVVKLSAISMLTGDDPEAWTDQWLALSVLQRQGPIETSVCVPGAGERTLSVGFEFRYFPLSAEPEQLLPREMLDGPVKQLLGPADSPGLGGDAEVSIEAMKQRASDLFVEMTAIAWGQILTGAPGVGRCVDAHERNRKFEQLRVTWDRLKTNSRALEEAGQQLKDLWMANRAWPADARLRKKAAARLALVAHLMNETPVLSCASGNDFNRSLDPSIKFLATVAANLDGKVLPPRDPDAATWAPMRKSFKPH